jgi:photosystem II stability/assembly factor-like uncharacterized protein
MKKHFVFAALLLLSCAKPNQAQEPCWELFGRGLYGVIAVDPTNSDVIYVSPGEPGMWKTTDRGQSWNLYRNGWGLGQTLDILIDPQNPEMILASGSPFVGILKSTDGGQNWVRADTGLVPDHHGYMVWSLALDNQRRIFYAAHDGIFGGVLRSADGVHWQLTNPSGPPFNPLKLLVDESIGVLYAGTGNGIGKSLDDGSNWTRISNGLPFQSRTPPVTYPSIWHIAKIKNSQTLYCAVTNHGIYKSFDSGGSWFSVNDSAISKLSFWGGLVVAEKDTNTIYSGAVATLNPAQPGGIYLSRNGGKSWTLYNFGLADSALDFHVTNLVLDNRANVLYASIGSVLPNGRSEEHMYRLRDVATAVHEPRFVNYPAQLTLHSYPNPFNNQITFVCSIHKKDQVLLRIFDILGKEVMTLFSEQRGPGDHRVHWNGTNIKGERLPSGIYLAKLQLGNEVKTTKLLLLQ